MLRSELITGWVDLVSRTAVNPILSILCLNKVLSFEWCEMHAKDFAAKCHRLVQHSDTDFRTKICLAYRGLEVLRIKLKEPGSNLSDHLASVPQVISLLEDLKFLTTSYHAVVELPLLPQQKFFHEACIPQAEVCSLLMVAYGACVSGEKGGQVENSRLMLKNGDQAFSAYIIGLQGSSTPQQRKYYHIQVVIIAYELIRQAQRFFDEGEHDYEEISKKSSLQLARVLKDERKEINQGENPVQWCDLTYKTALAYYFTDKPKKALKYTNAMKELICNLYHPSIGHIEALKRKSKNLKLKITQPESVVEPQLDTPHAFLN